MRLNVIPSEVTNHPWYADGLHFECTGCGNCCTGGPGYVWISDEELSCLAVHLRTSVDEIVERYCRRIGERHSLKECRTREGNYDCIFLEEQKAQSGQIILTRRICSIYPVRPLQCRTWPFWDGMLASRQAWDRAAQRCPGMNQGRRRSREEIERMRGEV